jgi:hypothetical protein
MRVNNADPDNQHRNRYWIVIEPVPALRTRRAG